MRIQRISDGTLAEHVDIAVVNAAGATITLGYAAAFTTTAASVDGIKVVLPAAGQQATFAGIALRHVPNVEVGLIRAYGVVNSTFIFATGTSGTNAVGIALGPGAAASNGVNSTGLKDNFAPVVALEAIGAAINSPGGYAKTFVRAL